MRKGGLMDVGRNKGRMMNGGRVREEKEGSGMKG